MPDETPPPLRIFWSYSHADEELRDKLDSHLAALKRSKRVQVWHDRKIAAGSNWRSAIDRELEYADIILLLVSATFLNSDFCTSIELSRAIERHQAGEALVIPIMLRPCDVAGTAVEQLQQLPLGGRPITKWGNRDEACQDVASRLRIAIEEWNSRAGQKRTAPAPAVTATAAAPPPVIPTNESVLTRVFGLGSAVTLTWVRTVLNRAAAVARIETVAGQPFGTGFLVEPADFGFSTSDAPLLLTCSFIIDPGRASGAMIPEDAIARFEIAGVERRVESVLWSSPVGELYSTLVSLDAPIPGASPIPITARPLPRIDPDMPADRVVLIGHPGGRELQFSLQDAKLLDADERRIHYRAATEGGSSGSPVLDGEDLRAIAIHASRRFDMPRLNGRPGAYEACEGISVLAIREEVVGRKAR